ncbi:hypothetical protein [Synechococcus phage DSL-LC02]|nr:hypothetical protein [Synechococcus phage DSL-LC02]
MTYDELYDHVVHYVAMSHTTFPEDEEEKWTYHCTPTEDHKRRACLILGAFMEFILDCQDAGIDPRTLDMNGFMNEKLDEIEV